MRRPRVLVADDDKELRSVVVEILEDEGFDPVPAPDGGAAWKLLAAGERFDVLLLDDDMPGVRGYELVGRLRALGDSTPAIIASGSLELREPERQRLGLAAVLRKPVPTVELLDTLRRAIESCGRDV